MIQNHKILLYLIDLIQSMDSLIGIKNSCHASPACETPFEFSESAYDQMAGQLNILIPHIDRHFGFASER